MTYLGSKPEWATKKRCDANGTRIDALNNVYEDDIDFSKLIVKIYWFRHLVQSSEATFEHSANVMNVL